MRPPYIQVVAAHGKGDGGHDERPAQEAESRFFRTMPCKRQKRSAAEPYARNRKTYNRQKKIAHSA